MGEDSDATDEEGEEGVIPRCSRELGSATTSHVRQTPDASPSSARSGSTCGGDLRRAEVVLPEERAGK